ncbi:hypothetical protein AC1031_018850 [Aphanomyces cochlioides]|nr:hypothetical protein AC1031_018850 [Aphanomyces cochlioides]
MTLKYPIPDDFFDVPPLKIEDVDRLRALGCDAAQEVIEYCKLTGGPVDWTYYTQYPTATVYKAREDDLPMFLVKTEIQATIEDVVAIFTTTTTSETRQVLAGFAPIFLDKIRVANLTLPTAEDPHFYQCLNW